ncbi:CAP domain-containing protein [Planococcus lenghuensis]|uniref:Serine protease n=1 Tax=Planococcus lenghuensis TaxID=2213202 RepID=A0A1Q2KW32_9BACL|nr:CAP-associated domain-containing protein [Planococcus lenghuensis]AQQ52017.1 serine protease [Planococcus lenghuensis]
MKKLFLAVLLLTAAMLSKPLWEDEAKQLTAFEFLAPLQEAAEGAKELTRRVTEQSAVLPAPAAPHDLDPTEAVFAIGNVTLGMTKEEAQAEVGLPLRLMQNEYGTRWHSYHQDYQNFMLLSYDENARVNGMFTNQDMFVSAKGITMNSTREEVRGLLGAPLEYLQKGNIQYLFDSKDQYDVFRTEDAYITIFYDLHEKNTVTAVQVISDDLENQRPAIYAMPDEQLKEGYEMLLFELTNSARIQRGLPLLAWDEDTRAVGRKHSVEMAENSYFSHTNLAGLSPFERMQAGGVEFYLAGENLAYGQYSSIFAHEGLMNSAGHRENILKPAFRYLGVGVSFNKEAQPFFTADFFDK